jgi:hypothetical protein
VSRRDATSRIADAFFMSFLALLEQEDRRQGGLSIPVEVDGRIAAFSREESTDKRKTKART